ncbi:MAG: aminoglycoside phosphotransferase family protein [Candidatus Microsaccharimonas sp.]
MQELLDIIRSNWDLTNAEVAEVLQQSGERVVYKISSQEDSYVFKTSSLSKSRSQIEKDVAIFPYLEKHHFPAPRLLKTKTGADFIEYREQFLYALTFIDGLRPEANEVNYKQLGKLTADLHKLTDYSVHTDFNAASVIEEMIEKNKVYPIGDKYEHLLKSLPDFEVMPKSLIHTDIGLHNTVQKPDGQIVLVDWDDAGIGTRILDIGFPLICGFVSNNSFDSTNAQAYYASYFQNIDLTPEEKSHIFDAGLFYILMYSIFDGTGIDQANWEKAQFAVAHRPLLETMTDTASLDPYTFDQTDQGWAKLDKQGDYLGAAKLIEDYIQKNETLIKIQDKVSLQTIHFHAGQEYAMSGEYNYEKAIQHFRQAFKNNTSWDVYVNGSIAFLNKDTAKLEENANKLDVLATSDDSLRRNATLLRNFLTALRNKSYSYVEVYGE